MIARQRCGRSRSAASSPTRGNPGSTSTRTPCPSLAASIKELGVLQPVLVRQIGGGGGRRVRAHRRRASLAGGTAGRTAVHPGSGSDVRRDPESRTGSGGEPPSPGPQRAGRGGRLPAADRGVRLHPRAGGEAGGQEPDRGHQHPATPAAAGGRPASAGRGPDQPGPRPCPAGHPGSWLPGDAGQGGGGRRSDGPGHRGSGAGTQRRGERRTRPAGGGSGRRQRHRRGRPGTSAPDRSAPGRLATSRASSNWRSCCPAISTPGSRWT